MNNKKNIFANAKKNPELSRIPALIASGGSALAEKQVYHSARIPESLSREIKRLAFEEDTSVQALTVEALQLLLKKRGVK